jgi:hypothetical protein
MPLKDIAWPYVLVAEIPAHCFILGSISTKFTSFNVRPLPKDPGRPVLGGASIIRRRGEIKKVIEAPMPNSAGRRTWPELQ